MFKATFCLNTLRCLKSVFKTVKGLKAYDFLLMPNTTNQPSFKYPPDHLLHFTSILSNDEMHHPGSKTSRGILILKRGCSSGLTIGYVNNICSILSKDFINKPDEYSNEVVVLPYSPQAFFTFGDSGMAVVNGSGAIAGLLTSGSLDGRKDKKKSVMHLTILNTPNIYHMSCPSAFFLNACIRKTMYLLFTVSVLFSAFL